MEQKTAYICFGGNMGDTLSIFKGALKQLWVMGYTIHKLSHIYRTKPWGHENQNDFLNMVACIGEVRGPTALLDDLQEIENIYGREDEDTRELNGPRPIDLDILLYENAIEITDRLIIPHPGLHQRHFALVPAVEIAPDYLHPGKKKKLKELLALLPDGDAQPGGIIEKMFKLSINEI